MISLVVYESLFGNTAEVAAAVADGLARHGRAEAVTTEGAARRDLAGVDLLVVGAPTHAWGLPRARTFTPSETARPTPGPRVRDWLANLAAGGGRPAAAFDTRLNKPRLLTGSAATKIARRLRHHGWTRAAAPASFVVTASEGPLVAAEVERARTWGDELGRAVARVPSRS